MKMKRSTCANVLKTTLLLVYFFMLAQILAMKPLNKPFLPDLTEQESISVAQKENRTQRKKQCYDLIMILDQNIEKYGPNKEEPTSFSCSYHLVLACINKSFPIIVSSNIVENYCSWKKGSIELPSPLVHNMDLIMRSYPTSKDWYCYSHKKAQLILFIPKTYIARFIQTDENASIDQQIKLCGFDVSNLHAFEDISPDILLRYIEDQRLTKMSDYHLCASDIESFFIKPTQFNIPYVPSWNIYLDGHGHLLSKDNGKAASMAGLNEDEFYKLMKIFETIKTSFLFYTSCYSAGQNLIKVQNELAKLNVSFMVGAVGINEAVSCANSYSVYSDFFNNLEVFFGEPDVFFKKIRKAGWTKDPISFLVSHAVDKKLLDVLQPWIYIPAAGVFNAFSVDKSIKILTKALTKAHEFEDEVIDFTDSDIRTIIVYPTYIGVPVKIKAHVAIVSPTGLMIESEPVTFEKNKKEKEEDPDAWSAKDSNSNIIHFFEKIIYEDKLSSVIPNFLSFQASYFPISFVIKELMCFDYNNSGLSDGDNHQITLNNVIISKYRSGIAILFNYNSSSYSFFEKISPVSMDSKELFERFANLVVSQLEPNGLGPFLAKSNLLKHCGLDKDDAYSSIEEIVQGIELKINKEFMVQKHGALKKSLLLKQKNILEKYAHPFAELYSSNDPGKQKRFLAYQKNLPQRIEQAKKLEGEIKNLPWNKIIVQQSKEGVTPESIQVNEKEIYLQDVQALEQQLLGQYESFVQQPSSVPWRTRIKNQINSFFSSVSAMFSNMTKNIQEYITQKMFSPEKQLEENPFQKQR